MRCDKHWGLFGYYAGQECPYCEPEPVQAQGADPAHVEVTFQYGGKTWTTTGHVEGSFDVLDAPRPDPEPAATPAPDPSPGACIGDFIWTGDRFYVVGHDGAIETSPDGVSWTTSSLSEDDFVALRESISPEAEAEIEVYANQILWRPNGRPASEPGPTFGAGATWAEYDDKAVAGLQVPLDFEPALAETWPDPWGWANFDPTQGPAEEPSSDFEHALDLARQMTHGLSLTEAQLEGVARAWTVMHNP